MIVELLLQGEREPEDLHRLFSYAREEGKARFPQVKDIGDFNSHVHNRDSGETHDRVLRFHDMARVVPPARVFDPILTMDDYAKALTAALELVRLKIRDYSGIPYSRATVALSSIISKSDVGPNHEFCVGRLTEQEARLWRALTTCPKHDEILTQQELTRELSECLVWLKVLHRDEVEAFAGLADWIGIYALSRMHFANIVRTRGSEPIAKLRAATNSETGTLAVYALTNWGRFNATRKVFVTGCGPEDWCAQELLDTVESHPEYGELELKAEWNFPIRLSHSGKLVARRQIDQAGMERTVYVSERPNRPR